MEPAELISNGKNTQIKAVVQPDAVSHLSIVFFKTRRSGGTGAFMRYRRKIRIVQFLYTVGQQPVRDRA